MKSYWYPRTRADWAELAQHPISTMQFYLDQLIHGQEITEYRDRYGLTTIYSDCYGEMEARAVTKVILRHRSRRVVRRINGFILTSPPADIPMLQKLDGFVVGETELAALNTIHDMYHYNRELTRAFGRSV